MGYTHPMDDGQERTFKVKFEGKVSMTTAVHIVSFFSQVVEELQSKIAKATVATM